MKTKKIIVWLVIMYSSGSAESKPGDSYILTGGEKSIDKIVQSDMDNYPDLYKGESHRLYVLKFKLENNIGKRKLAIGDELIFPETKASINAKAVARRQLLIGKWQKKDNPEINISRIKSIEIETVIEFKDNGVYLKEEKWITELVGEADPKKRTDIKQGTWSIEGNLIKIIIGKNEVEYAIKKLTEDELQATVFGTLRKIHEDRLDRTSS